MLLSCCVKPEIAPDNLTIDRDADTDLGARKVEAVDEVKEVNSRESNNRESNAREARGGKGKGKGKDSVGSSSSGKSSHKSHGFHGELVDGLPLLPSQMPMVDGSWSWIRQSNDHNARRARLEAGEALREAFRRGGYAVKTGGKLHKTRFKHLAEMLEGTRILSISRGLPSLGKDPKHKTVFEYGGHPIERAAEFTLAGLNCVTVNAASAYHAGGGFTSGGRHALEEAFCTQSTLYPSLEKIVAAMGEHKEGQAHIPVDGVILSPHVELFRRGTDQGYVIHPRLVKIAGVVSVAMYNRNPKVRDSPLDAPEDPKAYEQGVLSKIQAMVQGAILAGADALIVPDIGCGVFENNATLVGRIIAEVIHKYQGYFKRVLFTGKPEFFDSAAKTLMVKLVKTKFDDKTTDLKAKDHKVCPLCGKPLGGNTSELCLLLSPTGHRADGLQFLHASCADKVSERWPDFTAMTLPTATSDPDSFLRALDVDGNGILSKDEVYCAVCALWSGDPAMLDTEFEAKWKMWDTNASGDLDVSEIAEIPKTFASWLANAAVSKANWKTGAPPAASSKT